MTKTRSLRLGPLTPGRVLIPIAIALALAFPQAAWAKHARIKWKSIRGAKAYELEILQDGEVFKKLEMDDPSWSGELPSGVFTYRVRGIDRFKRPGSWSSAKPLFITPPPPVAQTSTGATEFSSLTPNGKVGLKWETPVQAPAYEVVIKKGNEVVRTETVHGASQLEVAGLSPGEYQFQVRPIYPASKKKGRSPASLDGSTFKGEFSPPLKFALKRETLDAPSPIFPKSALPSPADRKVELKWEAVANATAYQVQVDYLPAFPGQKTWPSRAFRVTDTRAVVPVPPRGKVAWKVRALAAVDPKTQVPGAVGPQAQSTFELQQQEAPLANEPAGYIAVSGLYSPYNYSSTAKPQSSPGIDYGVSVGSSITTARLSGEYFFDRKWGIGAGFDYTNVSVQDNAGNTYLANRNTYELMLKYRTSLSSSSWFFAPKIGAELRSMPVFVQNASPSSSSPQPVTNLPLLLLGPSAGFDLRKQFGPKFGLGMKVSYYVPLTYSSPGGQISGATLKPFSALNLSVGLQGLYWLSPRWGVGVGGYYDFRGVAMTATSSGGPVDASVVMNSANAFMSVIYTFSR